MYSRAILLERIQLAFLRGCAVAFSLFGSVWIWHRVLNAQETLPWTVYVAPSVVLAMLTMVVMWTTPARNPDSPVVGTWLSIFRSVLIITVMALAFTFFYRADSYSRGTFAVFVPFASVAVYLAASLHLVLTRVINANADASRRVVVIGIGEHGRRVLRALLRQPTYYSVVGYLSDRDPGDISLLPRLGELSDLERVLDAERIEVAMIALPEYDQSRSQELIGVCMTHGVDWKAIPPMLDLVLDAVDFEYVDGIPLVGQRRSRLVGYNWYLKRAFDIVTASVMLLVLSPILLVAWALVATTSKGPAVFKQQRIGLHGRPFTLLKFRTMKIDTTPSQHQQVTAQWIMGIDMDTTEQPSTDQGAAVYKIKGDRRITKVGAVLRATSIDELPQLWNVVRGDMSLVGPRPPIAYEVARYTERHKRRLDVPPGVTGLWQVSGRNKLSFDEMVDLDLAYIERWSLALDIEILLKTIPAVVSDHGY